MIKTFFGAKLTRDRIIILLLCGYASGGLLLFWLIPKWKREDRENEAKEVSHG